MSKKIYVGNLKFEIDDKKLKEIFSSFGHVEEAVVIKNKFSGKSKGFGFVTFTDDVDLEKVIAEMNHKEVEGRPLKVDEARPMEPRDSAEKPEKKVGKELSGQAKEREEILENDSEDSDKKK